VSCARLRRRYRHAPWYRCAGVGLVAVDLGKRKVGVAAFDQDARLARARTIYSQVTESDHLWDAQTTANVILDYIVDDEIPDWVCEYPQLRHNDRANHHNITALQLVGDVLGREIPRGWAERYKPSEWKRSVAKKLHHSRVEKALEDDERAIWNLCGHDARDAIAIGLFALGRTNALGFPNERG